MDVQSLIWVWNRASAALPAAGLASLKARLQLTAAAARNLDSLRRLHVAAPSSALHRLLDERPEAIGNFVWPFQNAAWDVSTRWRRIEDHCRVIDALGSPFDFSAEDKLEVVDLSDVAGGLKLVIDQPFWFLREGLLVLNLFVGDFRAFCLAFSFCTDDDGDVTAYIGAVQGRSRDDAMSTYRDLTKALFGLRPRDFLIESFRIVCSAIGVKRIFAVADQFRHHRHPYFGAKSTFPSNYDELWAERDGIQIDEQTFELPIAGARRDLNEVKPNKRSLYRKRYDFLDQLAQGIREGLKRGQLIEIDDQ